MRHRPLSDTGESGSIRSLVEGLAITALSAFMLLGGFRLSQLDAPVVPPSPTRATEPALPSSTPLQSTLTLPPRVTPSESPTPTPSVTVTPTTDSTLTPVQAPTSVPTERQSLPPTPIPVCLPPAGWVAYSVQQGDTLGRLAASRGTTTRALMQANCLSTTTIYPGQTLNVPPTVYATATRTSPPACGPPLDWVVYYVRRGDTLYSLARNTGTTVDAVKFANCLSSNTLYVGQALYLPALPPPPTPTPLPSATATGTAAPTATVPAVPSSTPSPSFTATATPAPSLTPTDTLTPTVSSAS